MDVEYDGINDILYYASGHWASAIALVKVVNNTQINLSKNVIMQEKEGFNSWQLIALDPKHPEVLYLGGYTGDGLGSAGIQRSCDG